LAYHDESPSLSFLSRAGGRDGGLKGLSLFIQGLLSDDGTENLRPAACGPGLAGLAAGSVKSRLKTAKRARPTRRSEMWRVPSRGTGRPQTAYCRGIACCVGLETWSLGERRICRQIVRSMFTASIELIKGGRRRGAEQSERPAKRREERCNQLSEKQFNDTKVNQGIVSQTKPGSAAG
jgi:hypothetical protein